MRIRSVLLLPLFLSSFVFSGEALWPLNALPLEEIEKDWKFKPDEKWIKHVQQATARVAMKDMPGGGSGAFVSPDGLLVTNRHCIDDMLAALSTPERNILRDGFYANSRDLELETGMEICVLREMLNVTDKVVKDLRGNLSSAAIARLRRQVEERPPEPGVALKLVPLFAGHEFWLYVYDVYPAKLVFAPDEALGAFGGEEDNFRYPRHKLDIAFLRAYKDGEPLKTPYFALAAKGPKEGDQVFVAGSPGMTERYLPLARIEFLREKQLPLQVATGNGAVAAIQKFMNQGAEQRRIGSVTLGQYANELKINQGALDFFKRPEFIAARKKQEEQWREKIAASPEAAKIASTAFADIESACVVLGKTAAARHFQEMPSGRFWGLAQSLLNFSNATRGKQDAQIAAMAESFSEFVDKILDPAGGVHIDVERDVLAAWLGAAKEHLPADHRFLKLALNGTSPEESARTLLSGAERLTKPEAVKELVSRGFESIDEAKLPILKFVSELKKLEDADAAQASEAQKKCDTAIAALERARACVRKVSGAQRHGHAAPGLGRRERLRREGQEDSIAYDVRLDAVARRRSARESAVRTVEEVPRCAVQL